MRPEIKMKRTIEKIMDKTTPRTLEDGTIWYKRLNRFCRDLGEKYNQPVWKVTAIMSALSPRTSFANNIHDTEQLLKHGRNAYLKSPLFRKKAVAILDASCYNEVRSLFKEQTGRKTLSFWENMNDLNSNRVTIDVHMIRHLGIEGSLTDKKYREAEKAIQDYAKEVNIKPYQLQAVIWCTVRGESF
jgi:uncharacterized protein (DUF2252 family)